MKSFIAGSFVVLCVVVSAPVYSAAGELCHAALVGLIDQPLKQVESKVLLNSDRLVDVPAGKDHEWQRQFLREQAETRFKAFDRGFFKMQDRRLVGKTIELAQAFSQKEGPKIKTYEFVKGGFLKVDEGSGEVLVTFEGRVLQYLEAGYKSERSGPRDVLQFFKEKAGFFKNPLKFEKKLQFASEGVKNQYFNDQKTTLGIETPEDYVDAINDYFFTEPRPGSILLATVRKSLPASTGFVPGQVLFAGINFRDNLVVEYYFDGYKKKYVIHNFRRIKKDESFLKLLYKLAGEKTVH